MKNKCLFLVPFFLLFATASCQNDDTFDVKVRFEKQAGYTPDGFDGWPRTVFLFDRAVCTAVETAFDEVSLKEPGAPAADRIVALVYESAGNLVFGRTAPGGAPAEYYVALKDAGGEVPRIWAAQAPVRDGAAACAMKPLTSGVKVNFQDAPAEFESLSFTLPALTDAFYPVSGKTELLADEVRGKRIVVKKADSGLETAVFPMLDPVSGWTLDYTLHFAGGEESAGRMSIEAGIAAGQSLELNIDFSGYESENLYAVTYRYADYGSTGWTEQREACIRLYPGDDFYKDRNPYYNVYVLQGKRWKSVEVRNALCSDAPRHHEAIWNDWNNSKGLRDTMCFANFIHDFDAPVKVRVQKRTASFNRVQVRPSPYGIEPAGCGGNTVEFVLPGWDRRKVSVEFDGDRYHNLFLLPDKPDPEKPAPGTPNVRYYGAGEHTEERIVLSDDETLYLDEGAVLYSKVEIAGNRVKIAGRGILSGAKMPHTGTVWSTGEILIEGNRTRTPALEDLTVTGITIVDSPSWTLSVFNTDRVTIDNVNIICWILNGDGIDLCSVTDATVDGCLIRCYDDCISLKVRHNARPVSDVQNVKIRNCTIWSDFARGIVIGPECGISGSTGTISDCTVEDCIILEHPYCGADDDERAGLSIAQYPSPEGEWLGAADMRDITVRNLFFDNIQPTGRPVYIVQAPQDVPCLMENIRLENIRIRDDSGCKAPSVVKTHGNTIRGLVFEGFTYNGVKILGPGERLQVEEEVEITFR